MGGVAATHKLQTFFSAVEQTQDCIFITDRNGVITYVNPAFEKTTGYSQKEALGKTPQIVKSGLLNGAIYKRLWETILSGSTFRATFTNRRKDGTLFYADHTITPIKDEHGHITHFVGIWKDITERVELEKRKEEFVAIASHELKTPVTIIKAYAQILGEKLTSNKDTKAKYIARQINLESEKINKLVRDLLDTSRIEAGQLVFNKEVFVLNDLVNRTLEDFRHIADQYILVKKGWTKKKVLGDKNRIEQVLINLLSNAIKHSPVGSRIFVHVKPTKNSVTVSVQDSGSGIPKKYHTRIFERFVKIDHKKRGGTSSFGLGLYISQKIIKNHKGEIWVESKPGKGATFFFTLPTI